MKVSRRSFLAAILGAPIAARWVSNVRIRDPEKKWTLVPVPYGNPAWDTAQYEVGFVCGNQAFERLTPSLGLDPRPLRFNYELK